MTRYTIEQQESAVVLWEGDALDKTQALDSYAIEAGYADYADLRERLYDDIPAAYEQPQDVRASNINHAEMAGLLIHEAAE